MFDDDEREQVPLEAREIHQQLVSDSSRWARGLPADARIADFARTLPQRMPTPSAQQTRNILAHRRPSSTLPDMMSVKGQPNMFKIDGPRRAIAASIAAVAVVALIVGVLYTMNSLQSTRAGSGGGSTNNTVVVPTPEKTPPPTPGPFYQTPGPLAKYVSQIVTAGGRSSTGEPTNVKTHFLVGDYVYVVAVIRGLPKGAHTISIRWYLNGVYVDIPAGSQTTQTIDGDKRIVFALEYPTPGMGIAKIYIDRPVGDTSESSSDPYLAETITFDVEMPQSTRQPGDPTPTPFVPTATPMQ